MVHKTNRKITVSVFVVGKVEPIKREIIYLPVENGGLGLLEPNLQQKALRLRFLQNIVNPLCKTKWVILARYWIGFQLARINTQWKFLGENHLPKPDKNIYPNYYGDILHFAKIHLHHPNT